MIHGDVTPPGPYPVGPGEHLAGPGIGVIGSGAAIAVQGGAAVRQLQLPQQRATAAGRAWGAAGGAGCPAEDWLNGGLNGRSAKTIKKNENVLAPILAPILAAILAAIGARRLRELTADDVHQALIAMARRYSSAAVAMGHNALTRVIRHAEARDLVGRNVAVLVDTPRARPGGRARA